MEYLWNRCYLEKHFVSQNDEWNDDIRQQISILEKVIDYDPRLEPIFNAKEENNSGTDVHIKFRPNITISAVLIVKNEERCILRCLHSILEEFDEIIIVDTGSDDRTIRMIQSTNSPKIKLYHKEWRNDFSEARNYALRYVTMEWAFFIDADEYLDIDGITVKEYLSTFQNFPYIDNTIFSPKIIDANGKMSIGVERIFRTGCDIKYYGKVHEELRKYHNGKVVRPFKISLDLPIKHDGYIEEVFSVKEKMTRNLCLVEQMIEEEPENPRWAYFYLRDGKEVVPLDVYKEYINRYLLVDINKPIGLKNLKNHSYTYAMLTLYAIKEFLCGEATEAKQLIALMECIRPGNSDSMYLSIYLEICSIKKRENQLLRELIAYRKENENSQYGMLHSEGKHLDLLIGYLLFQTGHIQKAMAYFDLVEDIAKNDTLVDWCKSIVEQVESICFSEIE